MTTRKSEAEPPILMYVFKKISRLNEISQKAAQLYLALFLGISMTLKSSSSVTCGRDGG